MLCISVPNSLLSMTYETIILIWLSMFRDINGPPIRKEAPHLSQEKSKEGLGDLYEKEVLFKYWHPIPSHRVNSSRWSTFV